MAFDPRGDELHSLDMQGFEEPDEALMSHQNAEGRPAEVQRPPRDVDRKERRASQLKAPPFIELPRVDAFSALIPWGPQVPAVM